MYGLDKDVDLTFLVGKQLLQVCVGLNQVILNHSDGVSICDESILRLNDGGNIDAEIFSDKPELASRLVCLLGSEVDSVVNNGDGNIKLKYSNGYMLTLYDGNDCAESYTITSKTEEVIV